MSFITAQVNCNINSSQQTSFRGNGVTVSRWIVSSTGTMTSMEWFSPLTENVHCIYFNKISDLCTSRREFFQCTNFIFFSLKTKGYRLEKMQLEYSGSLRHSSSEISVTKNIYNKINKVILDYNLKYKISIHESILI